MAGSRRARGMWVVVVGLVGITALVASEMTAGAGPRSRSASWWAPPVGSQPWQWELDHPLSVSNAGDMGTNDTLPNGKPAPPPVIYDIDGIINPASTVAALHARASTWSATSRWGRPVTTTRPPQEGMTTTYYGQLQAAGVFGARCRATPRTTSNIQSTATVSIIESMIDQQCAAKGFDAVETDIDEEYKDSSGFALDQGRRGAVHDHVGQLHARPRAGLVDQEPRRHRRQLRDDMYPMADAVLTEQCNQYSTCGALPVIRAATRRSSMPSTA